MGFSEYKPPFDREGFVVVRQFLPPDQLQVLIANLDRYIRDIVPNLPDADAFYQDEFQPESLKQLQHMGQDAYFEQYRQHPCWVALAETLLDEPVRVQQPEWFNKPPGSGHLTPPHQDNFYFNLIPPNVVTLWLSLDRVDEENGCLRYVSQSHHRGIRPHGSTRIIGFSKAITDYSPQDADQEVAIRLEPGDLVAHHGNTIHRADANRSVDRNRRAFAMVCRGKSCRRDEGGYARYLQQLTDQHRQAGLQP